MKSAEAVSSDTIKCPKCGELIPITATLQNQLRDQARADVKRELASEQIALTKRENELQTKEAKLQEAEKDIENRVAKRLSAQRETLVKDALGKAREEVSVEMKDLKQDAAAKDLKLQEAQQKELQLRKEKRELDDAKRNLELEVARKIDAERQGIREDAVRGADEKHRRKDAEKDLKLQEALKMNEELNRKLQQGSQQTQGEALELDLEHALRDCCPLDQILPVPKGVRGADVLQTVNSRAGTCCGRIIWEAKHTKNWSDTWIPRLKDDQQEAKADIAVLVTDVLPTDVDSFGIRHGVWITTARYVPGLVAALRVTLEEVAQTKRAVAGKNETVEALFNYLTGPEFGQRVEAIMRAFIAAKDELEQEKRTTTRRWAKREKQLDSVIKNTSGMYGDLQGLIGAPMKPIAALESAEPDSSETEERFEIAAQGDGR